jgi:hypothetical protein
MSLNFLQPFLDSRVTFSRGSNATLVDSTGKITYAPANLLVRSEEFDNASWLKSDATVTANTTTAPDGTTTADTLAETATTTTHFTRQSPTVTSGTTYTGSVYLKKGSGSASRDFIQLIYNAVAFGSNAYANFNIASGTVTVTGAGVTASISDAGNGWYRCSITGTAIATGSGQFFISTITSGSSAALPSYLGDVNATTFIWGAQLEPVTYQTTPSTYVATTTAAYYGPRFDYDPVTLAAKGLLIEEARTNLLLQSQTFDTATWSKSDATVTANATTAPDGTSTADKLAETATTAGHYLFQSAGSAATHTASIYAKAAERSWIIVTVNSSNTFFNLSNGTVGSVPGGFTTAITDAGNGWYRCSVTATLPASGPIVFSTSTGNNVTSYAGTAGSGIFLWGAQLEAGAFATSYIPTVASTVTRSADVATMTGTNFSSWYNATQGTFVAGFQTLQSGLMADTGFVIGLDNSTSKRILYIASGADVATTFDGTLALGAVGDVTGSISSSASAYTTSERAIVSNGGAVNTGSVAAGYSTATSLNIGQRSSGNVLNGHIRQIAYYNTRLPNATLQTLTAPPLVTTLSLDFINGVYNA